MKSLEEIENISFEELERMADDPAIRVPLKAGEAAKASVMAAALSSQECRETRFWRPGLYLAAAVAACSLVLVTAPSRPKDTFTDPELAYLQVERTMSLIARKMDSGMAIAQNAPDPIDKMNVIINKLNR